MNQGREEPGQKTTGAARASTLVVRNTVWNVLGNGLPLLLALVTFPVLIHSVGPERFGVLMMAWVILGYFGLFDLGLGRATIKFLAEASEHGRVTEVGALFWTSLILNVLLGLVGGLVLMALARPLTSGVLNIPAGLQPETLKAFYLMAWAVPLVTTTATIRGILEARHRFGLLNAIQVPTSALNQLAPLMVLPFGDSLTYLVGALVLSRLVGMLVFLGAALRQLERPFSGPFFMRERLAKLFSYGGWLTVTNVIGPLMVYADRFVIGSLMSMSAVTYYATPYEAATRLWVLPQSLTRTAFPIFSADAEARLRSGVYRSAIRYLALTLTPIVATIIVFASEILRLWLGDTFAETSTLTLQILVLGVLINSLASVPFTLVQALGRTDITAKFHLLELPFYLLLLWYGVQAWGIVGAAFAWTTRVSLDGLLLALYVRQTSRLSPSFPASRSFEALALASLLVSLSGLFAWFTNNLPLKLIGWGALSVLIGYIVWEKVLTSSERHRLIRFAEKSVLWLAGKHPPEVRRRR